MSRATVVPVRCHQIASDVGKDTLLTSTLPSAQVRFRLHLHLSSLHWFGFFSLPSVLDSATIKLNWQCLKSLVFVLRYYGLWASCRLGTVVE